MKELIQLATEEGLREWTESLEGWTGIRVVYEKPYVDRLWRQWGKYGK